MKNNGRNNNKQTSDSAKMMAALMIGILVFSAVAGTVLILMSVLK